VSSKKTPSMYSRHEGVVVLDQSLPRPNLNLFPSSSLVGSRPGEY